MVFQRGNFKLKTFHKNATLYLLTAAGLYGLSIPFINKPVLRIATVLCMAFFPLSHFSFFCNNEKSPVRTGTT